MQKSTTTLSIGELAKLTHTGAVTIRYYEKRGLIQGVLRSIGGHRLYDEAMLTRLHFISNAKLVGFTLDEIGELLVLQNNPGGSSAEVKQLVINKIQHLDEKVAALQRIKNTLSALAARCDGKGPSHVCPILNTLQQEQVQVHEVKK